jgi:hypothetical protein
MQRCHYNRRTGRRIVVQGSQEGCAQHHPGGVHERASTGDESLDRIRTSATIRGAGGQCSAGTANDAGLVEGKRALVEGKRALVEGKRALVEGKRALVEGKRALVEEPGRGALRRARGPGRGRP